MSKISVYFLFQIFCRIANISNDERNMIGLPVEGEDEEEEDINIEANIPAETEPEPVEIIEGSMREQEPCLLYTSPSPRDS